MSAHIDKVHGNDPLQRLSTTDDVPGKPEEQLTNITLVDEEHQVNQPESKRSATDAPSVTFASVTFSDRQTFDLSEDDVVVLVGPNNAGKSVALREFNLLLSNTSQSSVVVKSVSTRKKGSVDQLLEYIAEKSDVQETSRGRVYSGYRYNVRQRDLRSAWNEELGNLRVLPKRIRLLVRRGRRFQVLRGPP